MKDNQKRDKWMREQFSWDTNIDDVFGNSGGHEFSDDYTCWLEEMLMKQLDKLGFDYELRDTVLEKEGK